MVTGPTLQGGHPTLPETNSSLLKTSQAPKGGCFIFQPSIFRGKLAVSFREGNLPFKKSKKNVGQYTIHPFSGVKNGNMLVSGRVFRQWLIGNAKVGISNYLRKASIKAIDLVKL